MDKRKPRNQSFGFTYRKRKNDSEEKAVCFND